MRAAQAFDVHRLDVGEFLKGRQPGGGDREFLRRAQFLSEGPTV
ncbi:hypothetical protein [Streptomyces sp. UG1]